MAPRWNGTDHLLTVGLASAAAISVLCYWYFTSLTPVPTTKTKKKELPGTTTTDHHRDDENIDRSVTHKKPTASTATNTKESSVAATSTPTKGAKPLEERTPLTKNTNKDEKVLHEKIEELDKKGKVLFKNKQVSNAAEWIFFFFFFFGAFCSRRVSYDKLFPVVFGSSRSVHGSSQPHSGIREHGGRGPLRLIFHALPTDCHTHEQSIRHV